MLGELLSANCESDGQDGGHGDGDTADQKDEEVVEAAVAECRMEEDDFEDQGSESQLVK